MLQLVLLQLELPKLPMLSRVMIDGATRIYLQGADPFHPYASPTQGGADRCGDELGGGELYNDHRVDYPRSSDAQRASRRHCRKKFRSASNV